MEVAETKQSSKPILLVVALKNSEIHIKYCANAGT